MHNVFVRHTPRVLLSVIYVQRPHCKFPPPPRAPHGTPPLHHRATNRIRVDIFKTLRFFCDFVRGGFGVRCASGNDATCRDGDVIVRKVRRMAHRSVPPLPSETYKAIVPLPEDAPACSDDSCQLQALTKRWLLSVYNYCPPGSC